MANKEILKEIDKKIESFKNGNGAITAEAAETIILDLEKLIGQYKPKNELEKRFIKNRIDEINGLKVTGRKRKKEKRENTFYGKVARIDFADYRNWMKENEEYWKSKMQEIRTFNEKYPFRDYLINRLSIKEYVMGTLQSTFCWYLENGTPGEMGQRSSYDYYIYWSWEDQKYAIWDRHERKALLVDSDEAEKIFDALKENLETMLKLVDVGNIDLIEDRRKGLELPKANILQKILFLYFPDRFIGYYSSAYVAKIAAMLGINVHADVFVSNHAIAQKIEEKIIDPEYSRAEMNIGFTIYLYTKWNSYIKQAVE